MFRIIKTIQKIFLEKKQTASPSYLSGFGDCLELLKTGFGNTSFVNPSWENLRLKGILLDLLESESRLSKSQLSKINDLFLLYNDECKIIDKLYYQLRANQPGKQSQLTVENTELKLKYFLLKEAILKLIHHKFNLSQAHTNHLLALLQEHVPHNTKIDDIVNYIIDVDLENSWPDHHQIERENQELRQQIEIKTTMLAQCTESAQLKQREMLTHIHNMETLRAVHKNARKELRNQVQHNQKLISRTETMQNNIHKLHPAMPDEKAGGDVKKENDVLKEIVGTLIRRPLSRYDRYNLNDIFSDRTSPVSTYTSLRNYLNRNSGKSIFQPYQLSESDKTDIKKILSGTNTQESPHELYNFISYLCNEDRKGKTLGKRRQGKKKR